MPDIRGMYGEGGIFNRDRLLRQEWLNFEMGQMGDDLKEQILRFIKEKDHILENTFKEYLGAEEYNQWVGGNRLGYDCQCLITLQDNKEVYFLNGLAIISITSKYMTYNTLNYELLYKKDK
jgi:hypothetical protein